MKIEVVELDCDGFCDLIEHATLTHHIRLDGEADIRIGTHPRHGAFFAVGPLHTTSGVILTRTRGAMVIAEGLGTAERVRSALPEPSAVSDALTKKSRPTHFSGYSGKCA